MHDDWCKNRLALSATVFDLFGDMGPSADADARALNQDFVGRSGEFLVCSALSEMGVVAHHVPSPGYDVLADGVDGMLRVQVKTAARGCPAYKFSVLKEVGRHRRVSQRLKRPLDKRDCDVVALVALDRRRAIFLPVERCSDLSVMVTAKEFDSRDVERISWASCLKS